MNNPNNKTNKMLSNKVVWSLVIVTVATVFAVYALNSQGPSSNTNVVRNEVMLAPLKLQDLSKDSDAIIVGKVTDISVGGTLKNPNGETNGAYTLVTLQVEKDLTGNYKGSQIQVKTYGGYVNGVLYETEEEAKFTKGERVLAFLKHVDNSTVWGDSYVMYGLKLGKYHLENGNATGDEFQSGIDENEFIGKINTLRATK